VSSSSKQAKDTSKHDDDLALRRAKDLVELHYAVKVANQRGELGRELTEAREKVRRARG